MFSEIIISNGGSGYSRDDTIVIKDSKSKIVETVKIKKVSSTGQILNVEKINQVIPNFGNYTITIETAGGSLASLNLGVPVATITKPRVYTTQKSLISSDSFIQDNNKYQQFSYIIKAEKSLFEYTNLLKKLFHQGS